MSLISRIHGMFSRATGKYPAFMTKRNMDFGDKGKAEENVYFRKEQERLLAKLRKLFSPQKTETPNNQNGNSRTERTSNTTGDDEHKK